MPIRVEYGPIADAMQLAEQAGRGPVMLQGRQQRSAEADRLIGRVLQGRQLDDQRRATEVSAALRQRQLNISAAAGERGSRMEMLKLDTQSQRAAAGQELAERKFAAQEEEAALVEADRKGRRFIAGRKLSLEEQWRANKRKAAAADAKIDAADKVQETEAKRIERAKDDAKGTWDLARTAAKDTDASLKRADDAAARLRKPRTGRNNIPIPITKSEKAELGRLETQIPKLRDRLRIQKKAEGVARGKYEEALDTGEYAARVGAEIEDVKAGGEARVAEIPAGEKLGSITAEIAQSDRPAAYGAPRGASIYVYPAARARITKAFLGTHIVPIKRKLPSDEQPGITEIQRALGHFLVAAGWSVRK